MSIYKPKSLMSFLSIKKYFIQYSLLAALFGVPMAVQAASIE